MSFAPADSSAPARTFRTGPDGTFRMTDLPARDYRVEANRWFDDAERSQLTGADDAIGFVGATLLTVAADTRTLTITLPTSRRQSVVISEWSFNDGFSTNLSYSFGGYFELYNNSDTTVFLDGMTLGRAVSYDIDLASASCAVTAQYSNDPAGIWTLYYQRFPGSGRDYPLPPGASTVVATDAIDHRSLYHAGLDLRGANFEYRGTIDADNPTVPDMVPSGFGTDPGGHGLFFSPLGVVGFLTLPVDEASLTTTRYLGTGATFHPRMPANKVLDIISLRTTATGGRQECPLTVHPSFDRQRSSGRGTDERAEAFRSLERKPSPIRSGGRIILQHTRNSSVDFFRGNRTVGVVSGAAEIR